jgi:hypothetical protein
VDVHIYHTGGGLPSHADNASYVGDASLADDSIPLIAGECGIPKDPGPSEPHALANYLVNADTNGYAAAFLWKLEGDLVDSKAPDRRFTSLGFAVREVLRKRPAGGF